MFSPTILQKFRDDVYLEIWSFGVSSFYILYCILLFQYGILGRKLNLEVINLFESEKIISTGTAVFNHTLKNELAKITVCSSILKNQVGQNSVSKESIKMNMDIIERSIKHLDDLSARIRDYSVEIILNENEIDIVSIIDESIIHLNEFIIANKIKIIKKYKINAKVIFDGIHLKEIIVNLLKNAIEASKKNSKIEVGLFSEKKSIVLQVRILVRNKKRECQKYIKTFYSTKDVREKTLV